MADGQADPRKIVIEGISLGALTAALVAADTPTIAGLVLISGLFDLAAFVNEPRTSAAAAIKSVAVAQTGGSLSAFKSRSALFRAVDIRAATLVMNGAQDNRTDPDQAKRFAEVINAAGGQAEVRIFPNFGHEVPFQIREPIVDR